VDVSGNYDVGNMWAFSARRKWSPVAVGQQVALAQWNMGSRRLLSRYAAEEVCTVGWHTLLMLSIQVLLRAVFFFV